MRNGPFTLDEVFDRIAEILDLPEETNDLFNAFLDEAPCGEEEDESPLLDILPNAEQVEDGFVYRVSVNESESGNTLASAVFQTEEQGQQAIDLLLLLQELNEHGLH